MTSEQAAHERLLDLIAQSMVLSESDRYIVLTFDPECGERQAYGPLSAVEAMAKADADRRCLDEDELKNVEVYIVPCSEPS